MLVVGFLSWWYGYGWQERAQIIKERLVRAFDFFSIDLLLKTWFSPFRQIGTEARGQSLGDKFRALTDQLISRVIGATVRSFTILAGLAWLLILLITGILELTIWLIAPFLPVLGAIMFAIGWTPNVEL